MKTVCRLDSHYCHLYEVLGQPEVSQWQGLVWTRWHVRHMGDSFVVSAVSGKALGDGSSCTCKGPVAWDVWSSTEQWEAVVGFVNYVTDGEFGLVDQTDVENAA